MWCVFLHVDGHKRGQTSRSVVGNKIQTNSNFKAHMYHNSYVLDFIRRQWIFFRFTSSNYPLGPGNCNALSVAAGSFYISHNRIVIWCSIILIPSCSVISIASYTKIFRTLRHHQARVQDHVQQQPSQTTALNMARYRKAANSALWVLLALAVCYVPKFITLLMINYRKTYSLHVVVIDGITCIILYSNSTLNPFLYCWRVREVRKAVKQTIRQAFCFPLS